MAKEGWARLMNTTKWHYFDETNMSLCRKWMAFGGFDREIGNDDHPDNCATCQKAKAKRDQKAKAQI